MKSYKLGLYEKAMPNSLSFEEKMIAAKKAGFDYIEISIDETDEKLSRLDWDSKTRKNLVELMQKQDMPIRSMCLSGHRKYPFGSSDEKTEQKSLDIMQKALQLADDLGIRVIQLAGYDVYYEQSNESTREKFEKNLKKAVYMANKYGIVLGFETMENDFMDTVEKSMYYVNKINSPYLGVYPDCGNLTNASIIYKKDVVDDIATGSGHIVAMHLKETVVGKYREIPFGTGHVDFDRIIEKATSMGIRRFVTELWHTDDKWEEHIKFANDMMREKIEKYI